MGAILVMKMRLLRMKGYRDSVFVIMGMSMMKEIKNVKNTVAITPV